jgi:hypothetical protein
MIRLLLFCIALILHLMHCIILLLAHIQLFYTLDHAEPEPKVQVEQAQVEGLINLVWIKASLGALINAPCLLLYFESYFIFLMVVH